MAFPEANWRLLEARVDYWSGTTDDRDLGEWAYERAREYIESDRLGELTGSGASVQGYVGIASQHTMAGQREGSTFVRLSSADAGDRWADFGRAGLRASRIDLCCTLLADRDVPDVAYSVRYDRRLPARIRGKPPGVLFMSDQDSGDCAYVGGTRSVRRGRIYDKARESKGAYPVGAWRWELQARHGAGAALSQTLVTRERPTAWISAHVRAWFDDRGIPAPWVSIPGGRLPPLPAPDTTDATRLLWLKTSIAPMVERMKARYTMNELRGALGLLYRESERTHTRISR